ncbi:hypothetical protein BDV93DRAFT_477440 [Ceratobasidium sp. AG-I]|nr:hypothetical protein BDV93DRAFT_477440 [Ceratobasidium sp. AG-I]
MPPTRKFAANLHRRLVTKPYQRQPAAPEATPGTYLLGQTVKVNMSNQKSTPPLFPSTLPGDDSLPASATANTVLAFTHSLAKGTISNYQSAIKLFTTFCDNNNVHPNKRFPANETLLCVFAASMASSHTGSSISGTISGLKTWHALHNQPWQGSQRLSMIIRGISTTAPIDARNPPRPPITTEMLVMLGNQLNLDDPCDAAIWAAALIAFWAQCRLGELLGSSRRKHDSDRFPSRSSLALPDANGIRTLSLPRTKTRRASGDNVHITQQEEPINPEQAIKNHFHINNSLAAHDHLFAFRAPTTNTTHCLTKEVFINRCNEIWSNHGLERFTGHAFRIGGTSTLLRNGVDPNIVKELGRWSSDAFFKYWRDIPAIASNHANRLVIGANNAHTTNTPQRARNTTTRTRTPGRSARL